VGSGSAPQHVTLKAANPAAAAAAAAGAPATAAVAAAPAAPIPAGAPGAPPVAATAIPGGGSQPLGTPNNPTPPTAPVGGIAPPVGGTGTAPPTQAAVPQQGVLGGTVSGLDNTASRLGLNTNLSQATQGLTTPLDNTTRTLLNNVGGLLGDSHLGDTTTQAVNGLTGSLLGGG
jgi:hypothetical protein